MLKCFKTCFIIKVFCSHGTGNIRVMCRVRPIVKADDSNKIVVTFNDIDDSLISIQSRNGQRAAQKSTPT